MKWTLDHAFLAWPCVAPLLLCPLFIDVAAADSGTPQRPNIIWIVGENFDLDLGCYHRASRAPRPQRCRQRRFDRRAT
jgi:hypothetical protein